MGLRSLLTKERRKFTNKGGLGHVSGYESCGAILTRGVQTEPACICVASFITEDCTTHTDANVAVMGENKESMEYTEPIGAMQQSQ